MEPGPPPQPMLARPKKLSPRSTSIVQLPQRQKLGRPFSQTAAGPAFAGRRNFAISHTPDFFAVFLLFFPFPFLPPPHLHTLRDITQHNVLASRPDIAGSAHPRCSARPSCVYRRPEDRHDQCGFGAGRQELDSRGEFGGGQALRSFDSRPRPIDDLMYLHRRFGAALFWRVVLLLYWRNSALLTMVIRPVR